VNTAAVEKIANAVLYEGYMLYPYRPSAVKNRQRFNFGVVCPQSYSAAQKGSDPWIMQIECLVQGFAECPLEIRLRFLQLVARSVEKKLAHTHTNETSFAPVRILEVDGQKLYSWEEAVEREVAVPLTTLGELLRLPQRHPIRSAPSEVLEALLDDKGAIAGRFVRRQRAIDGTLYAAVHPVAEGVYRMVVRVKNSTPMDDPEGATREQALMHSLVSAHIILGIGGGEFSSLLDPPEALREAAAACRNIGAFPVLAGEEGQRDTILASPIILYDYPQIAPESAGDLFDGAEIDEILSLRILTLTDEEKREMRQSDQRARQVLERTEAMPEEQLMKLHGVLRGLRPLKEGSR